MTTIANSLNNNDVDISIRRIDRADAESRNPQYTGISDTAQCRFATERSAKPTFQDGEKTGSSSAIRSRFRDFSRDPSLSAPIREQAKVCLIWLRHLAFNPTSPFGAQAVAEFHKLESMMGGDRA